MNGTHKLGTNPLPLNRIGLGCMGMSEFYGDQDDAAMVRTLHAALDMGINFFDTADMYGCGRNEELLGRALAGRWSNILVATKFGNVRGPNGERLGVCGRPDYIRQCCDKSLKRLGIETIDLYYQHRPDPAVPIEESVGTMKELVEAGKVRQIGISEFSPEQIRRAQATHPVAALQTEYSLWTRDVEAEILPLCRELGIAFVAYSPLGRGFLTGTIPNKEVLEPNDFRRNNPRFTDEATAANRAFVEVIAEVARAKNATPAQVALAWVLAQGDDMFVIPGTTKIHRLEENLGALKLHFTKAELAALRERLPATTVGTRY